MYLHPIFILKAELGCREARDMLMKTLLFRRSPIVILLLLSFVVKAENVTLTFNFDWTKGRITVNDVEVPSSTSKIEVASWTYPSIKVYPKNENYTLQWVYWCQNGSIYPKTEETGRFLEKTESETNIRYFECNSLGFASDYIFDIILMHEDFNPDFTIVEGGDKEHYYKIYSDRNEAMFNGCKGYETETFVVPQKVVYNNVEYDVIGVADTENMQTNAPAHLVLQEGIIFMDGSFTGASHLKSVSFPSSLIRIGGDFIGTSISEIEFPEGLVYIATSAFRNTQLEEVTLPQGLRYLGGYSFDIPSLKKISIPPLVSTLATSWNPQTIEEVTIEDGDKIFKGEAWCARKMIIGRHCYKYLDWKEDVNGHIGGLMDNYDILEEVVFTSEPAMVGILSEVTYGGNHYHAGRIRGRAEIMTIACDAKEIPRYAISRSYYSNSCPVVPRLKELYITGVVEKIGIGAFLGCKHLEKVVLPEGMKEIGDNAFYGCTSLKSITIPSTVVKIAGNAFGQCTSLEEIIFLPGEEELEITNGVFDSCPLKRIYQGRKTKSSIQASSATRSASTAYIPQFSNNPTLEVIEIGENIAEINNYEYAFNSVLDTIICYNPVPPTVGKGAFARVSRDSTVLVVPEGSEEHYKAAAIWTEFINLASDVEEIVFDESMVSISYSDGVLHIVNCQGVEVAVSNVNGTVEYVGCPEVNLQLTLSHGLYIVKVGDKAIKVLI